MNGWRRVLSWMRMPRLEDEAAYRRGRFVNLALLVTGFSAVGLTVASSFTNPRHPVYYAVFLALTAVLVAVKQLLHRGFVRIAAWLSIAFIWCALSISVGIDGVTSPALPSYLLLIMMAAAALDARGAWIVSIVSVAFLALVTFAERGEWLDPDPTLIPTHMRFLTHAAQIFLASGLVLLISRENRLWLERATSLFESAPDPMLLVREGRVLRVNRALCEMMHEPDPREVTPVAMDDIALRARFEAGPLSQVLGNEPADRVEMQIRDATDRPFEVRLWSGLLVECRAARVNDTGDVQLTLRDLTARRELENQVRVAQRMESVARLAGGVAHDFNNLLTVVQSNLSIVQNQRGEAELFEDAFAAVDRGAALTRQLLTFARQQPEDPKAVDVREVVSSVRKLLDRVVGEDVRLDVDLPATPVVVEIDPTSFEQVLLNLAVNARDAMPRGGVLSIAVLSPSSEEVVVEVSDTGEGMDPATIERVFEPFFTTKEPGRGTGLGLAVVHGVINAAGGTLVIRSARGEGTTVTIRLPVTDEEFVPRPARESQDSVLGGDAWVYIVEDDHAVRRACARLVGSLGYRVTTAALPDEALAYAKGGGAPPDILLVDTIMPGMNGPDLAVRLLEMWPDCRVVLTSGYAGDGLKPHLTDRSRHWPFLGKPYSRVELANVLRRARLVSQHPISA